MSIVVAKYYKDSNYFVFAADSQVTSFQTAEGDKDVKLFGIDGLIFGIVGRADVATLIRLYARDHKPARVADEAAIAQYLLDIKKYVEDHGGEFGKGRLLIGWQGRVWFTQGFYIRPVTDYAAIGSGDEVALGALLMGAGAQEAVEVTTRVNIYCNPPIKTLVFASEERDGQ